MEVETISWKDAFRVAQAEREIAGDLHNACNSAFHKLTSECPQEAKTILEEVDASLYSAMEEIVAIPVEVLVKSPKDELSSRIITEHFPGLLKGE